MRSRTGRGLLGRSETVQGILEEVRDGSRDDRGGSERFGEPFVGPGQVWGSSRRFGT